MLQRAVALTALLAAPSGASAQSVAETVWSDMKTVPGDLLHVWTGPVRIDGDEVETLVVFTVVTGFAALSDREIQALVDEHAESPPIRLLEPFSHDRDALSRLGQNHWVLRGAGVGYVAGLVSGQDWLREAALGCAVGNTSNALPRKAVYSLIARTRPRSSPDDAYDFDVPGSDDWDRHSFFGGHAANAFTCASFFAHRWDLGWGEPVVWVLATGVAAARVADGLHWTSDTLVGSAFGFFAGRMIAERYLERESRRRGRRPPGDGPDDDDPAHGQGRGARLDGVSAVPFHTAQGGGLVVGARVVF